MKKNLGSSAGVLALLAVAFHFVNTPVSETAANRETRTAAPAQSTVKAGALKSAEPDNQNQIEGPWLATQTFFHQQPEGAVCFSRDPSARTGDNSCAAVDFSNVADLEKCSSDEGCRKQLSSYFGFADYHTQFLIASVPDPLHTRLSLFTDSSIEAIEQAAFDSHWEFATQWLPWRDNADPGEKNPESRRKQRLEIQQQEEQPGLLVFRHTAVGSKKDFNFDGQVLLIFLVGETPTAGVNGVQFRSARAYMRAFGDSPQIKIAAPLFSGSFYSLTQLIKGDKSLEAGSNYSVMSGTATNAENAAAFKKETGASFHGLTENTDEQDLRFRNILASLHIPMNQAAILVEDESGFSKGYSKRYTRSRSRKSEAPHVLRFPREISHLRNIYRDVTAASRPESSTQPEVEFTLKDPESGEDSVPSFSSTQTPIAQNAVLGEIIGEIRRDRIRIVELAATNVLDTLFLSKILRRQCPDTRLLITSPDLLFVQETQLDSLTGMLAMSSYPLFFTAKDWLGEHVTHESTNAAGLYNAVQFFLLPSDYLWLLNDYSWKGQEHPSTWLTTLDRQGFSPLKLFPPEKSDWFTPVKTTAGASFRLPDPPSCWVITTNTMAVFSFLLCGWILYLNSNPAALSWTIPAPDGGHIADAYRLLYLLSALLTLAAMQAVLYIPFAGDYLSSFESRFREGQSLHIFVLLGTLFPIAVSIWLLPKIFKKPRRTAIRGTYVAAVLLITATTLGLWTFCCLRTTDQAGFFFSFRALELRAGSSPALPVLFLLFGLFLFFLSHLIRFYIAINQRPRMFTDVLDRFFKGRMRNCRRDLNRALVAPMNFTPRRQAAVAAIALAVTAIFGLLCRADVALATTDGRTFDWLVIVLATLLVIAIIATIVQVKISWAALQPLLIRLNLLPLGAAFSGLRDAGRNGPIWARRLNLQSLDIPTRSSIVLHNICVLLERQPVENLAPSQLESWRQDYWSIVSKLIGEQHEGAATSAAGKPGSGGRMDRNEQRKEFCRLRYLSALISDEIIGRFLLPEWRKRVLPWGASANAAEKTEEAQELDPAKQDAYDLAQCFVALQFSMFVNYGVRQIQNLILAVSLGFGIFVLALNVYSFQSPQMINWFFITGFTVLGYICWKIMSQMERDPILSRLSGTVGGELNKEFYLKLIGYGALPFLGLLSSLFPSIGSFLSSWVQPSLQALR